MSVLRKYNGTEWKSMASDKATGISTESPSLLKEGETIASVDDVLKRIKADINTLKGNVSWLALHGGGGSGSGGGGGSTVTEATCTLTVNDLATGNSVSMDSNGLTITLSDISVAATKSWSVSVRIGANLVYSTTASFVAPVVTVPQSKISSSLTNHTGQLLVSVSYEDNSNSIYGAESWSGTLYESVVNLSCDNVAITTDTIDTAQILYKYSVGIIGDYKFTVKVYKNNAEINTVILSLNITGTSDATKAFLFSELVNTNKALTELIGVYTIVATMQYTSNTALSISGTCTSTATLASEDILIAAPNMGTQENPNIVYIGGSLTVDFTAYVQGLSTFNCTIQVNGKTEKENTQGYFGQNFTCLISTSGKTWAAEDSTVTIDVTVSLGGKSATGRYYATIKKSAGAFLQLDTDTKTHLLADFQANNGWVEGEQTFNLTSSTYKYGGLTSRVTSTISLGDTNAVSGIQFTDSVPYLRIRNGAYGIVNNMKINSTANSFASIAKTNNTFTLSICFKADYHPDDERTVLFCGSVDNSTGEITSGISIDVHNIYINSNSVVKLTDNTVNCIDITCVYATTDDTMEDGTVVKRNVYIVKIYLDGTLTSISKLDSPLALGSTIYLGTRYYTNQESEDVADYLCDCNIYSLKLYDSALNDIDILTNYTNALAYTNYLNSEPNYALIDAELLKNFAERNSDNTIKSNLYKVSSGTGSYTIDFLMNASGQLDADNLNAYAKQVGLPVMLIDVSADDSWTFNNFVTQQTAGNVSLSTSTGRTIQYWDPTQTNDKVLTISNCSIGLQGTSTLADSVKNLNITVPDNTCFVPKSTWFPEQTYTLKADVVDSSHSNNAAIGKFINEVLGYDEETSSSYFPFDPTAISNVYTSEYKKSQQPTATLKHTVEGFPILLIMKFRTTTDSTVSVTPLGIYSFNIGRDAYRNLGFKKLNSVKETSGGAAPTITSFPYLLENVTFDESSSDANWIEIKDTTSIADMVNVTTSLPSGFNASQGDFWQNDDTILDARYEVRYPANKNTSAYDTFKSFVGNIMQLPIEGTYSTNNIGEVTRPQITNPYDLYSVDLHNNYNKTGSQLTIASDVNTLGKSLGFNRESMYKYFTIALFFGLVDNFGKNSTYRSWNGGDYFIDFYDLDTALGGSNQGLLSVDPDLWVKYLMNDIPEGKNYGYLKETYNLETAGVGNSTQKTVSANHNKLWMVLDTPFFRQYTGDTAVSTYARYWNEFRNYLQETILANYNTKHSTDYTNFADFFVDVYYKNQTGTCGSLLFNYDYKLKYLVQFKSESDYTTTKDITKLHGRKIAYTRDWLNKHILFLDSLFYWRDSSQTMSYRNNVASRGSNNVYNTPESFPIKTNTSLIIYNSVGNTTQTYYYVPKNTEVYVNAGANTSNSPLNWNFSNSPNIIQLGNDTNTLNTMNVGTLSHSKNDSSFDAVGYPSITELNLSNNTSFDTSFSLESFEQNNISEIRVLNFSKTKGNNFSLSLNRVTTSGTNYTKYTKLREIDISESTCVTGLTIPAIPLQKLDVKKSAITSLTLQKQKYISNVDLTGCSKLTDIDIEECDSYTAFSVSSLSNLSTVKILNCPNLNSIYITNCSSLKVVDIEGCDNLTSITISNCNSLVGDSNTDNYLTISGCKSLTTLDLHNNAKLTKFYISQSNQANIKTLILWNTLVSSISGDSVDTSLLDLSAFTSLSTFSIYTNKSVAEIKFANDFSNPIPLNSSFSGCTNLQRVYGNVAIKTSSMFYNLSKFSIHGSTTTDTWHTGSKRNSAGKVLMPYEVLDVEYDKVTASDLYLGGTGKVTNMTFTTCSSVFYGTNCTIFDMYYVMTAIQHASLSCSSVFMGNVNSSYGKFSGVLNSPNRYMFYYCDKVTSMSSAFRNTISGRVILYSPTVNEDGNVTADDGLFSPLTSCTSISAMYHGQDYITDRFVLRRSDDTSYPFTSVTYFTPCLVVDNVYDLNSVDETSLLSVGLDNLGNFSGFFKNLQNITDCNMFVYNTTCINYTTSCQGDGLKIPSKCYRARDSFNTKYAVGEIVLDKLFATPANITLILQSFEVSNKYNDYKYATWNLNSNVFKSFTKLVNFGYDVTGDGCGSEYDSTLNGDGVKKIINQSIFPFDIFDPCKDSIVSASSLFKNAVFQDEKAYSASNVLALPGTLFENTPNMSNVVFMFYNLQEDYTLTSKSFANCTNLNAVDYMFSADSASNSHLTGSIPNQLFYHGSYASAAVTRTGIHQQPYYHEKVVDTSTGETTAEAFWSLVENETYEQFVARSGAIVPETVTVEGHQVPNANIRHCSGVFMRAIHVTPYEHTTVSDSEKEINPDYYPFEYISDGKGGWVSNTAYNNYKYTYRWVYDGVNKPSSTTNCDNPEDGSTVQNGQYTTDLSTSAYLVNNITIGSSTHTGSKHFMCAPDLLRYCMNTSSLGVSYLFAYSGVDADNSTYSSDAQSPLYWGIEGRIVPYLLKPISSVNNIPGMFRNCKRLSSYKIVSTGKSYIVPRDFFSYAPNIKDLTDTFRGMIMPAGVDLTVFNTINTSSALKLIRTFSDCYYNGTSTSDCVVVDSVFNGLTVAQAIATFARQANGDNNSACIDSDSFNKTVSYGGGYVKFTNVFTPNTYTGDAYNTNTNFSYVFAGYSSSHVTHENPKTLNTTATLYNYTYAGGTNPS